MDLDVPHDLRLTASSTGTPGLFAYTLSGNLSGLNYEPVVVDGLDFEVWLCLFCNKLVHYRGDHRKDCYG